VGSTKVKGEAPKAQAYRAKNTRPLLATIPTDAIMSLAARRRRAMQTTPPTPEKLRACPHCEDLFGARRLRKHAPYFPAWRVISDNLGLLPGCAAKRVAQGISRSEFWVAARCRDAMAQIQCGRKWRVLDTR
jgi:hypothetical protein